MLYTKFNAPLRPSPRILIYEHIVSQSIETAFHAKHMLAMAKGTDYYAPALHRYHRERQAVSMLLFQN